MRLVLVRHAAVAYRDAAGGMLDVLAADPPPTALGLRQAAALAGRAADLGVSHLYTSPAIRAVQTAQAVAQACRVTGRAVPWLGEQGWMLEGWRRFAARRPAGHPGIEAGAGPDPAGWPLAGQEAGSDQVRMNRALADRARRALAVLFAAHPPAGEDRVVLCTHDGFGSGGLLRVLTGAAAVPPPRPRFTLDHASWSEFVCDARGTLTVRLNCTRHLAGLTACVCTNPACGRTSPYREARTCQRCGSPMMRRCPTCDTDIPAPVPSECPQCGRAYARR